MSWNYRIVKDFKTELYGLYEVWYGDDGEPNGASLNPVNLGGYDTPEELIEDLKLVLKDAEKRPIFEEPQEWSTHHDKLAFDIKG